MTEAEARADERARVEGEIVAWLRGAEREYMRAAADRIADAIAQGAHRPKGGT